MFDTIGDLPLHPLVVHAVVVLVPAAAVGLLALALVPRWRDRYAGLLALVSLAALALVPVATRSGEALATHVGTPADHERMGQLLIWFVAPVTVLCVVQWWTARRVRSGRAPGRGPAATLLVLSVVAALAAGFQVYRVGDSGARAAWQGVTANHVSGG